MQPFQDRRDAGEQLATRLQAYAGRHDVVVLGLPRGGVPVAAEVARALSAPLDVLVVRKLGVPGHEELAMGALASGGVRVLNEGIVHDLGISPAAIDRVTAAQRTELERRERAFRGDRPPLSLAGKTVLVIDDGIATGATMRSAVRALRTGLPAPMRPARIVVAAPVAATDATQLLQREADEVIVLGVPADFLAVGRWYRYFPQTADHEVRALLEAQGAEGATP
jgi:putative phosphoribosyl transferase